MKVKDRVKGAIFFFVSRPLSGMEAHFCQCDERKVATVSHYNEKLSEIMS